MENPSTCVYTISGKRYYGSEHWERSGERRESGWFDADHGRPTGTRKSMRKTWLLNFYDGQHYIV